MTVLLADISRIKMILIHIAQNLDERWTTRFYSSSNGKEHVEYSGIFIKYDEAFLHCIGAMILLRKNNGVQTPSLQQYDTLEKIKAYIKVFERCMIDIEKLAEYRRNQIIAEDLLNSYPNPHAPFMMMPNLMNDSSIIYSANMTVNTISGIAHTFTFPAPNISSNDIRED